MAKSVRYSCAHGHIPLCTRIGILVVIKAVIIMIIKGIEANLVTNPKITRVPHIISKLPAKYAQNAGFANPIPENLPVPRSSGNIYFCIPSVKNTNPTVSLTRIALLSFPVLKINAVNPFFAFMAVTNFNIPSLLIFDRKLI